MTSFLSREEQELVAIGAAVAANCEPCFRSHLGRATEIGVAIERIKAAAAIGQGTRSAPAKHMDELWQELTDPSHVAETAGRPCCM